MEDRPSFLVKIKTVICVEWPLRSRWFYNQLFIIPPVSDLFLHLDRPDSRCSHCHRKQYHLVRGSHPALLTPEIVVS